MRPLAAFVAALIPILVGCSGGSGSSTPITPPAIKPPVVLNLIPNSDSELGFSKDTAGNMVYDTTRGSTVPACGHGGSNYVRAINVPAGDQAYLGPEYQINCQWLLDAASVPCIPGDQFKVSGVVKRCSGLTSTTDLAYIWLQFCDTAGNGLDQAGNVSTFDGYYPAIGGVEPGYTPGAAPVHTGSWSPAPPEDMGVWVQIGGSGQIFTAPAHVAFVSLYVKWCGSSEFWFDDLFLGKVIKIEYYTKTW